MSPLSLDQQSQVSYLPKQDRESFTASTRFLLWPSLPPLSRCEPVASPICSADGVSIEFRSAERGTALRLADAHHRADDDARLRRNVFWLRDIAAADLRAGTFARRSARLRVPRCGARSRISADGAGDGKAGNTKTSRPARRRFGCSVWCRDGCLRS